MVAVALLAEGPYVSAHFPNLCHLLCCCVSLAFTMPKWHFDKQCNNETIHTQSQCFLLLETAGDSIEEPSNFQSGDISREGSSGRTQKLEGEIWEIGREKHFETFTRQLSWEAVNVLPLERSSIEWLSYHWEDVSLGDCAINGRMCHWVIGTIGKMHYWVTVLTLQICIIGWSWYIGK